MARRITLRDIAAKSGYHFTTISMALRGDPSIPESTRSKIRSIAETMGYSPDPMVQALASYRQTLKSPSEHAPLAWLSCDSQSESRSDYLFSVYREGAIRRASQFGYRLEEFLLGAKGMTPLRMRKILISRGITGILVAPQPHGRAEGIIDMDWSSFSAVTFGYSLTKPAMHLVTSHHANAARLAVRKLYALGYRRIGLYIGKVANERVAGGWLGGYAGEALGNPDLAWIEPFLHGEADVGEFLQWQRANRIDAVITWTGFIDLVRKSGVLRVPKDLGMASLRIQSGEKNYSGVNQNDAEIGVTAVDTLLGMLRANERGIPEVCRSILIEGTWQESKTTRRLKR